MPTEEQIDQAACLMKSLGLIEEMCLKEIMAGRGQIYSFPMIREALSDLEKQFTTSPEYFGGASKHEAN